MAWKYGAGARLLRVMSWVQIAVPIAAVVATIPGSLFLLLFGGVIIVAPPIALGVVGLGIAKGLRTGHRATAAVVLALLQAGAYVALALHNQTWDLRTQGEANFFLLAQVIFWIAAGLNVLLIAILISPATPSAGDRHPVGDIPDLRPALWPWVLGAVLVLATIVLGIAVPGSD